jgi:hypothetical protein
MEEEDLARVGWKKKKKIKKFPIFLPQNKSKESYRMKDFSFIIIIILAFVPNFTQKTKKIKLGCIVS